MKYISGLSIKNVKVLVIIYIFMQILFLYELDLHPARGYELSIYEGIPFIGWLSFLIGIFICYFLIFSSVNSIHKYVFHVGYLLLLLSVSLYLSLPFLKGYVAYASMDQFTHIGYTKDIIDMHHFNSTNIYPIIHILVSIISIVLNINPLKLVNTIPAFGTVLFIVSSTLLSKLFFNGKIIIFSALVSSLFLFGTVQTMLYPQFLSIELLPFLFYFLIKAKCPNNSNYRILAIIFIVLISFLYPLTSLISIIYLIFIEYFLRIIKTDEHLLSFKSITNFDKNNVFIAIIIFFIWYSSFSIFGVSVERMLDGIFLGDHIQIQKGMETLSSIQLTDKIKLFLKLYSDSLIVIISSLVAISNIFKNYIKTKKTKLETLSAVLFLLSFPLISLMFLSTQSQSLIRFVNSGYFYVFTPVLCGYTLMNFYNSLKFRNIILKNIAISLLILIITFISLSGVYHSSYILHPSLDVSNEYYEGTEWLYFHKSISKDVIPIGIIPTLHYAIGGFNEGSNVIKYSNIPLIEKSNNNEINLGVVNDRYIMINSIFESAMNNKILYEKGLQNPPLFMKKTILNETDNILNINVIYKNGEVVLLMN